MSLRINDSKICYLNNKRLMQGYISSMSVGVSVCGSGCPREISGTAPLTNMGFAQIIGVMILTKVEY